MKKILKISVLLAVMMLAFSFVACSPASNSNPINSLQSLPEPNFSGMTLYKGTYDGGSALFHLSGWRSDGSAYIYNWSVSTYVNNGPDADKSEEGYCTWNEGDDTNGLFTLYKDYYCNEPFTDTENITITNGEFTFKLEDTVINFKKEAHLQ